MNKKKIAEIVKFNVEKSMKGKAFIILNIILCLGTIIFTNLGNIKTFLKNNDINIFEEHFTLEILDNDNLSQGRFEKIYGENVEISYVKENQYTKENLPEDNTILVQFELDEEDFLKTRVVSKESTDESLYQNIVSVAKEIRSELFAKKYDITPELLEKLNEFPNITEEMLGVDAENANSKQKISLVTIVIAYMILIFALSRLANEVVQEKVSKSTEYVLTSVTAKEYLLIKVLSNTIPVILQLIFSFIYYLIGNQIGMLISGAYITKATISGNINTNIDMSMVWYILATAGYLILTVFLLSFIQAVLASKITNVADAGNSQAIILILTIVIYMISISCINPYIKVSTAMYIISCLPLVSTFFIPAMMAIGQANLVQIIISFVVLILSIPLIFNTCAKKFKLGVLDYTSKKTRRKTKTEKTLKEQMEDYVNTSKMQKYGFVIGMTLLIWFMARILCELILPIILNNIFNGILTETGIIWLSSGIESIISICLAYWFINSYTEKENNASYEAKVDFKTKCSYVVKSLGIVAVIQLILGFLSKKFGFDNNIFENAVASTEPLITKIIFVICTSVVPGIFEELLFRKGILNYSKKLGNYFGILVSALLFGLAHANIQQGIFAFLIGILFGIIAIKTNSIKLTIIVHTINNAFGMIVNLLGESEIATGICGLVLLFFAIIGVVTIIKIIIKNRKEKNLFIDKKQLKSEYKLIFTNYTFDIVIVLFIVLTITTEKILRGM